MGWKELVEVSYANKENQLFSNSDNYFIGGNNLFSEPLKDFEWRPH